jgi:CRP-like cAMP-binding protein
MLNYGALSPADAPALDVLEINRVRSIKARRDIIREGDDPKEVFLIVRGWACRYKMLEDGRRQIVSFFLPGDLCDLHVYILKEMDHSVGAITPVSIASISSAQFEKLCDDHPRVTRALWWDALIGASIEREWTLTVGQRDAYEGLAHLCCELYMRLRLVGLVEKQRITWPLTQAHLADALGLTTTHVGRTIRRLNETGLATISRGSLTIHDLAGLQNVALFNPSYLHFNAAA